jgi:ATP-dependent Clp protease ATP-binding subunit ClpA
MLGLASKGLLWSVAPNGVGLRGGIMFERFTDRARRVLVLAQEEARDLDHAYIGTEHILLGLIREGEGVAAKALDACGVNYDVVREKINALTELATNPSSDSPPFTSRAKKVLEMALREAMQLGHSYIGTEHILLGLVRQGDGVATQILSDLGVELSQIRTQVVELMSGLSGRGAGEPSTQVQFDGAIFRGVVRAVGQQLRPDLDAAALDEFSTKIADDLFTRLRQYWAEQGTSL